MLRNTSGVFRTLSNICRSGFANIAKSCQPSFYLLKLNMSIPIDSSNDFLDGELIPRVTSCQSLVTSLQLLVNIYQPIVTSDKLLVQPLVTTSTDKIFDKKLQFSCEIAHYEKCSISIFKEPLASIDKIFWALGYTCMKF